MDVENRVREVCKTYSVRSLACDPYRWQRSMAAWEEDGLPVVEWGTHQASRMVPATAQFYEAATSELISHDGHPKLAEHFANCAIKIDSRGPRISKDHKNSERHIDAAVAAVIAYDMAVRLSAPAPSSAYEERGILTL